MAARDPGSYQALNQTSGLPRAWWQRVNPPETRPVWLADPSSEGRLWMVRSPWPALSLQDSLNVLWTWVERDHASIDEDLWRERVSEALAWDETTAAAWHRRARQ